MINNLIYKLIKNNFAVEEVNSTDIGNPERILVIRQHNQLGDLLATVSLLRALKEKFPKSSLTLIASKANFAAVTKNRFIDRLFVFDKKKIYTPTGFMKFWKLLREPYDVVIVPVTVSVSFTSNFMARISNSKVRIGVKSLNGNANKYDFFFDRRVALDWSKYPDNNVSEFGLDIVRPFGITTDDFSSEITSDESDYLSAEAFISTLNITDNELLIGLHVGAGKPPNRWSLAKYAQLIKRLNANYSAKFYLTGSSADKDELKFLTDTLDIRPGLFLNRTIPEVAALISKSDLFITNDTGIMHVAGATRTAQISIFGPTNPYNWAPIGSNKDFLWKSDLIDDITVDDVYSLCEKVLSGIQKKTRI
ncbi:MAG: glycosyltransferase family 9 protein [Ignavibacteriales bacterium]